MLVGRTLSCSSPLFRNSLFGRPSSNKWASVVEPVFRPKTAPQALRLLSTRVIAPLQGEDFFNRESEIKEFKELFSGEPRLSIVSGPVNSGKTSLLLKIFEDLSTQKNQPVLHLNLRERSFNSVNDFQSSLGLEMSSWTDKIQEQAKLLKPEAKGFGLKLSSSQKNSESQTPIDRLNSLFQNISKQLPNHSFWSGKMMPVLFIDEASRLNALLHDPDGNAALVNLFEWFVMSTKESHQFHVVLSSSDSFFHLWVEKYVGSSRFSSYVVGDLSKDEARKFWSERVITRHSPSVTKTPEFEDAYSVCGGSMFLLKQYFQEYYQAKTFLTPDEFSLVRQERTRLLQAYFGNMGHPYLDLFGKSKPCWSRKELFDVMKALVSSRHGFLDYEDLCKEFGDAVVDDLIKYNILHLRPTKRFSVDLPDAPNKRPVVTAETPSALVAMKEFLTDHGQI